MNISTPKESLIQLKYIISRIKYKKTINKLNLKDKTNALFNDYVHYQIIEILKQRIEKRDSISYKLLEDEIRRINSLTESYQYGIIEPMTYEEMKNVINYYIDDIWTRKKTEQSLKKLFKTNKEKNYTLTPKVIKFPTKRTNV